MRVALGQFSHPKPEFLFFARQFGIQEVLLNTPMLPSENGTWALRDLVKLRSSVEQYGLRLAAIENVPIGFYDHIMLGGPRRNEQIEKMVVTIRNIARAGVPLFGYHWMPTGVWRTDTSAIRGGAVATSFDYSKAKRYPAAYQREYSEEELWQLFEEWIRIIIPVAEEEGIKLGVHPCDPPVPALAGVPQLFYSFASFKRLIEIVDSPSNCIEFCQGTFSEMEDSKNDGIYDMIDYFAGRKKILYTHFRNVSDTVPVFSEEFIDSGYVDMPRAMGIYAKNHYDSFFIADHVPHTAGDSEWGHRGRAYALGYIKALIETAKREGF